MIPDRKHFQNPTTTHGCLFRTDPMAGKATAKNDPTFTMSLRTRTHKGTSGAIRRAERITDEDRASRAASEDKRQRPPNVAQARQETVSERDRERMPASLSVDISGPIRGRELDSILARTGLRVPQAVDSASDAFLTTRRTRTRIVLDSFAGSGTTAHAVLALNAEDGGNRRFILVECEDYADTITAERVRRVIKGVPKAKDEALAGRALAARSATSSWARPIELSEHPRRRQSPDLRGAGPYVFYTATGEEFDDKAVDEKKHFIGESRNYQVYLFYEPDVENLKNTGLHARHGQGAAAPQAGQAAAGLRADEVPGPGAP